MFSTLPWYGKALCLVAFFAIMAVWGVAWAGVIRWLPQTLTNYLFVAGLCLAIGFLLGQRYGDR